MTPILRPFFLAAALCFGVCLTALADDYPNRPIKIIVPFPAGGSTDIVARQMSVKMGEGLRQPIIVENRPGGAGGSAGTVAAARAPADGYTLLLSVTNHVINPNFYSLPYDFEREFTPVSMVTSMPLVLVVHPSVAANSVRELIALGKSRPGQLFFSSSGVGGTSHVTTELFNAMAGTKFVHVPYKGGAPANAATLAGEVSLQFIPLLEGSALKSGKLRLLAISSAARTQLAPELPTVSESGVPGFESSVWYGLHAPAGTPRPIIDRLHREVVRVAQLPEVRASFAALGADLVASTPEEFAVKINADLAKWAAIAKASGAKVEPR